MMSMRASSFAAVLAAASVAACVGPTPPTAEAPASAGYAVLAVSRLSVATVRASGSAPGMDARRAVDGDAKTAWGTAGDRPAYAWLTLGFAQHYRFSGLVIRTGRMPEGTTFKCDTSDDGQTWTPSSGRLKNLGLGAEKKDLFGQGRYLRLRFFNSATAPISRFDVYEIEVLGEPSSAQQGPGASVAYEAAEGNRRYYPDWKAIAPHNVRLDGTRLRFNTAIANIGPGYLQIRNRVSDGRNGLATQEILDDAGNIIERKAASRFIYFQPHGHNHVDDIARYELKEGDRNGPTLRRASKISFCVEDSYKYQGDTRTPSRYPDCTPTLMGITPGYADLYSSDLPGQEFNVTGLGAGTYTMVVTVDPFEKFLDYHRGNNVAWTRIQLDPDNQTVSVQERSR